MTRQPKLMDFPQMRGIFESHFDLIRERVCFNSEIGLVRGNSQVFRLMEQLQPPFAINDYRLGIILHGEARICFNLVERHLEAGTLVALCPGTIISPVVVSADLEILGIALFQPFPMPFAPGQLPSAFCGAVRDFQLKAAEADCRTVCRIVETLWQLVRQADYNRQVVSSLVAALMYHYDALYRRQAERQQASQSRQQTVLDRFLYLVNLHAAREHQLSFYARKMCLTERYLGTVVRQTSGVTAKEWIDRALITRIKVELRHSDKTIASLADEFAFPNPSFFCKYFKRLTTLTPAQFRNS